MLYKVYVTDILQIISKNCIYGSKKYTLLNKRFIETLSPATSDEETETEEEIKERVDTLLASLRKEWGENDTI